MNAMAYPLTLGLVLLATLPAGAQGLRQQDGNAMLTHIVRQANDELRPRAEVQRERLTETDGLIEQIYRDLRTKYAAGANPEMVPERAYQLETPREQQP